MSSQAPLSWRGPRWPRYAAALGGVLLAWVVREAFMPVWGLTAVRFMFFWPALVFAAWFGRFGPALAALVLSSFLALWFFVEPRHALTSLETGDILALLVFVGTGFGIILVIEAMHRANARAKAEVDERKRSEENLRDSERTLSTMLRALPTAVALQRFGDGLLLDANEAFARLTGIPREGMLGRAGSDLGLHPDPQARSELLDRLRREGALRDVDARILARGGGPRDVIANMEIVELRGEACVLSSFVDVTEKKRAQAEIERLNADLDRRVRERTEELEAFTYSVAHDLRAPLRGIRGFSELLVEDAGPRLKSGEREYLERVARAAARMDTLIRDLLAYSRLGLAEVTTQAVDLSSLVREVLLHMDNELSARGAEVQVEDALPCVLAHRTTLFQALVNLVSNAAKFVAPDVAPRIRIAAESRPGWVRLVVEDNGIGIPPDARHRLFRVFERLHHPEAYPGTGIGLAIVRRALAKMGGSVGVEPLAVRGSRFWIELPAAA